MYCEVGLVYRTMYTDGTLCTSKCAVTKTIISLFCVVSSNWYSVLCTMSELNLLYAVYSELFAQSVIHKGMDI